jgi:hypothetical protein
VSTKPPPTFPTAEAGFYVLLHSLILAIGLVWLLTFWTRYVGARSPAAAGMPVLLLLLQMLPGYPTR